MYMRRLGTEYDNIQKPEMSPFKPINKDYHADITTSPIAKGVSGFYHSEMNEKGKIVPVGDYIGLLTALATFANIRGFDMSDIDIVLFDEFIPEVQVRRTIKNEGMALFNALETIGRNRELKGEKPLKLLAMANSNNMANEIFVELGIVREAEKLIRSGKLYYADKAKGLVLIYIRNSPISEKKASTALYKLTTDSPFAEMALDNKFVDYTTRYIKKVNLKEYNPLVSIGELTIYEHKSDYTYYATKFKKGAPDKYENSEVERARFSRNFSELFIAYIDKRLYFEDYASQVLFEKYIGK